MKAAFVFLLWAITLPVCAQRKVRWSASAGGGFPHQTTHTINTPFHRPVWLGFDIAYDYWAGFSLERSSLTRFTYGNSVTVNLLEQVNSTLDHRVLTKNRFQYLGIEPYGRYTLSRHLSASMGFRFRFLADHQVINLNQKPNNDHYLPSKRVVSIRPQVRFSPNRRLSVELGYSRGLNHYLQMAPFGRTGETARFFNHSVDLSLRYGLSDSYGKDEPFLKNRFTTNLKRSAFRIDSSSVALAGLYLGNIFSGMIAYDRRTRLLDQQISHGFIYCASAGGKSRTHSVGLRLLYHFAADPFDYYVGFGLSYGTLHHRTILIIQEAFPNAYAGVRYHFGGRYGLLLEVGNYRSRKDFHPVAGFTYRFGVHSKPNADYIRIAEPAGP
ncbi:hypothetical protein [Larkinella soli]|uniref:hypothetical protein n=1 Tax=Larkinella soli TaxID=1770527 RepID=UPI000FFB7465|nr:hypothetical protein [Larkinella soli]